MSLLIFCGHDSSYKILLLQPKYISHLHSAILKLLLHLINIFRLKDLHVLIKKMVFVQINAVLYINVIE